MAHRDAEATRKNILQAVGRVLSRDGFTGLGVNAIAKEAGIDADAVYAILLSGFQHLVLRSRVAEDFWGVPLRSEEDWKRLERAFGLLVHSVFNAHEKEAKATA